jgi:ABC-type branched-subunit amino acid transport system substrate-binding protein
MRRTLALPVAALASVLLQAGCSSTAPNQGGGAQSPGVTTDVGVTRAEITLGALTERSGPFSDVGTGTVHGEQMWINETNTAGGICGRKIKLASRDDGGNPGTAKTQYTELEPKVLGFLQIPGSSLTPALSQSMVDNATTAVATSKSAQLLTNPYVIIPATTYDIEMINGLSYLMEQGKIHDGDAIGHIWLAGEYGRNSLRGARYFAQRHHLTLRDAKVSATTGDIRQIMATFAAAPRVKAIALSTTPEQAAAAAVANQQGGLNVPMVGNSPVFSPKLLFGPAAGALGNLSVVDSSVPFSSEVPAAQHVAHAYQQAGYLELPNSGVPYGYAIGKIWGQLLTRACRNGDLSRAGIQEALHQSSTIPTGKLVAELSLVTPGSPAAREVSVGIPDAGVLGGIRLVKPLFVAPDARSYVAPHQNDG